MNAAPTRALFPTLFPEVLDRFRLEARLRGSLEAMCRLRLVPDASRNPLLAPRAVRKYLPGPRGNALAAAARSDEALERLRGQHRRLLREMLEGAEAKG